MNAKLRILHIITRLIIGGAQENTLYTAEILNKKGYHVDVLSGPQTGPEGNLIENAKRRNIPLFIEKRIVREINPIKDLFGFFRLVQFIRRGRYDIVHTHSSKAGISGRWAAWLAGCPIIVHTVHGWAFHDYQKPWLRSFYIVLERFTSIITQGLIAVSRKDILKGLASKIGRRSDYALIRSGIEIEEFSSPKKGRSEMIREFGIPQNAKVVGTVTRFSPQKSPMTFVHTAAEVIRKVPEAFFIMVGDGPLRGKIESEVRILGIEDRMILTGLRLDVPDLLQMFDIFLLTSLWEGLPRVIPQAMAAGLPVIASNVDGNAEIIKNNVNGILVQPGNINQTIETVIQLIKDKQRRQQLSDNARYGLEEYSVDSMVEAIEDLYMRFLRGNANR